MWKVLLSSVLKVVATKLPWELIVAKLLTFILEKVQADKPAALPASKVFVRRVSEQLAMLSAALEDNSVSIDEVKAVVNAWAEGDPTPKELEAKILG
jgi:hypothetical protein